MLKVYSYVVDHDFGLAPNPFGNYCTLTVCKGTIRQSSHLAVGDWIIGTGSRALEKVTGKKFIGKLIYAMQVAEIITLQQYWEEDRFAYKKPVLNGSLVKMYGDNFYHKDSEGNWIQEHSAHSFEDGTPNPDHLEKDTRGENAVIANRFFYYGDQAVQIPVELKEVCHSGVGQKIVSEELTALLITWIEKNLSEGVNGDPINWNIYNQLTINTL